MITSSNPVLIDYTPLTRKRKIQDKIYSFPKNFKQYIFSLFPILQWIHRYNFSWFVQDGIAGVTVGMLIVPQGIAYAKIANLDSQYGLYTSFVGATLYCFFGTSKDISIGPITVVSLLVGQAVSKITEEHPEISGPEVAVCLSLFSGIITLLIGLVRLGILVDFISEPAIAGYMTGSAITISLGQWPKIFGLEGVNAHNPPYLILYNFFKHIKTTKLDAAFGLVALVALYIIKLGGVALSRRIPLLQKPLFFLGIMRSGLVVIFGTLISYCINKSHQQHPSISIIQKVPAGFDAMSVPSLNMTILREASGILPSIIIILILEHVSVAKSFGRMNNYVINPNQEILAIGMSNIIGSFFGGYPCTGAFSRTAVMARSGAKSPMAGVFSGAVVVLALYVLTPAFYYIPESVLASVIIHAVVDLVSGPKFLKALWKASILEFFIFAAAVVITCFMDVETGIYVSVGLSLLLMLLRLARPDVSSLGRVKLDVQQHHHLPPAPARYNVSPATSSTSITQQRNFVDPSVMSTTNALDDIYGMDKQARYIYVEENNPLYNRLFDPLPPGVVVIQLSNSILYPNASYVSECISDIVKSRTRAGNRLQENSNTTSKIEEERTWNQPIPSSKEDLIHRHALKPYLECIVLDFSAVNKLDATALHTLHAIKQAMNRYAGGKEVEWHFCHIVNNHVRELLIESGFGLMPPSSSHQAHEAEEAMADMEIMKSGAQHAEEITKPQTFGSTDGRSLKTMNSLSDPMTVNYSNILASPTSSSSPQQANSNDAIVLLPFDRYPAFHWDMEAAVYSICERRQYQYQYTNNHSSITVTTAY